ncbi:MAG: aspartate aminotransferase family protein [Burkholderiales bacterium]
MTASTSSTASRDIANLLHPYTHLRKHEAQGPLVIVRGSGVNVFDDNGKEYIEALAGLWCVSLGFSEERLTQAAARQMSILPNYHEFAHKSHDVAIELAERLLSILPVKMSKVFFQNSGSEANDTAMKMVWYYWNAEGKHRKKKIISRIRGYHGVTVATAGLTGLPDNHRDFDLPLPNIRHVECPHYYRYGKPGESEEAFATRLAENLEAQILREDPETIGAFIAEPLQGAGGVIIPPRTYFEKIQPILKKYEILFIVDEVITGFGRTGNMFGAETYKLEPDIITVAKALSSGYLPISATIVSEKMYQAFLSQSDKIGQFAHGYTYSGHPVAAAVAIETLKIYEERRIVDHVRAVMGAFQANLQAFAEHSFVGEVRGVGLIGALEFVADRSTRVSFERKLGVGAMIAAAAQREGLIVRALGDTIAFCPPLIITEQQLGQVFERFGRALSSVTPAIEDLAKAT